MKFPTTPRTNDAEELVGRSGCTYVEEREAKGGRRMFRTNGR